ncbi:hypothetical protein ES332_D09G155700v1 [Gossypium tomentosum]|uniref:Uncharacterized protein n=1 Tax=Gossypium tomentosum TaxID=34277 RepID=A0A5D2JHL3_GOSTO|nr:hypothetical protein ES332_D09G155700v1 [Gossypium tomentosum]
MYIEVKKIINNGSLDDSLPFSVCLFLVNPETSNIEIDLAYLSFLSRLADFLDDNLCPYLKILL